MTIPTTVYVDATQLVEVSDSGNTTFIEVGGGDTLVEIVNSGIQISSVGETVQGVAYGSYPAGTPVAIRRSDGKLTVADPFYKPEAFVVGLLASASDTGFIATAEVSIITLFDWTSITGSVNLLQGQYYFLGSGGTLTTSVPSSGCLVVVGEAVGPSTMRLSFSTPLQL